MTIEEYELLKPSIPDNPGIYQFIDSEGKILYVGKAKNIRKRIASYFQKSKHLPYKTRLLVKSADHLDFIIVNTESDALLLENTLIKRHQPRYNVHLKDGKSYTYICIKKERFPRVFFTRRLIKDGSTYFGPYTSKFRARIILDLIRNLFPLRTCNLHLSEENIRNGKFKVCLEYHIKRCLGPCVGLESEEDYDGKIRQIHNILRGNFGPVKQYLNDEMVKAVDQLAFERAQELKEKLTVFEDYQSKSTVVNPSIKNVDVFSYVTDGKAAFVNYLRVINGAMIYANTFEYTLNLDTEAEDFLAYAIDQIMERYQSTATELIVPFKVNVADQNLRVTVPQRGDKHKLLELSQKNADFFIRQKRKEALQTSNRMSRAERILTTLKSDLNMEEIPLQIECFDNSNIQGSHPVASCVVFKNAKPAKSEYRKFNIKTVIGPDDYASMREVVYRRYARLLKEEKPLPQLIIIDGGKGQLNAAVSSLKKLDLLDRITVIGIAKRLEEIFFPDDPIPLYINKKSESLVLIQQLRNEAHRFAINFHRDQRSRNFLNSSLELIPGVGKKSVEKLLKHYQSIPKIKAASDADLQALIGKTPAKALARYFQAEEEE